MTRGRKPRPGRIVFVGSGPGDPGLLTTRAAAVLANAALVFTDPDVPEPVVALIGTDLPPVSGPHAVCGLAEPSRRRGAEQAGMQAAAAAAAYEAAFVMTVPPPVITANRVLVMTLIATNFFGQNSAAIAVAEAQYAEMWAQDAVAMYGYAAASASASRLIPFAAPPKTTNSAGVVAQAVASVSWPNPNDWWLVRLLGSITPTERTTIVRLLGQSYLATGMARFLTSIAQQLTFGPGGTTAGSGGAWYPTPQFAGLGAGPAVSASLARAEPVGRLSVPPSWAVAAPAFAEKPEAGTPMSVIGEASSCGQGGLLRGIPLARAGRRTGAFAHRYGFRHSVITRSPSAG